MAAINQEQFDSMSAAVKDDLDALPTILGNSKREKELVVVAIEQTLKAITTHGRVSGYNNVILALQGRTPKALSRPVTTVIAELANGYEHGDNPKSVLAQAS